MSEIDIRKTHPNLYRLEMVISIMSFMLGLNFIINTPTFLIFDLPNVLWGTIFLVLSSCEVVFLNIIRRLRYVRACMAFSVTYMMFLAAGTTQPFFEGVGSLQLPILYAGVSAARMPLMLEPFINPWTSHQ